VDRAGGREPEPKRLDLVVPLPVGGVVDGAGARPDQGATVLLALMGQPSERGADTVIMRRLRLRHGRELDRDQDGQ
jgi:hypothetical protein